ncbi:dTDP-4-dehydrorhamnose 3,5-epimerase family protein [Roseibacillus ishigakijimensis]|uniref:dTDP-4-dehydrorhamnose 3,5-epimerase n=1 Tax=Roseibacillus ishigakijimensis TaxID=454146 RepID=A0A934RQ76_9BACT|nr:dTDP-4-dehydrorhamnose 3,5-epimerase family protein [Roseibacillus ishigakijimensis]MBK1833458.1 dTDP-4-dehydrorhamnose 3,5-epimerase family protein [Roseibacillus ishigakijimensis]
MKTQATALPGVTLLFPPRYDDARGSFRPVFADRLHEDFRHPWAEMNLSHTEAGVIRGLHCQHPDAQAKLITVVSGRIFDVVVDLRPGANFGRSLTVQLAAGDDGLPSQIYLPPGLAHGFATPDGPATIAYLVSTPWSPPHEHTLAYNDPALAIDWPLQHPILSERDRAGRSLDTFR